MALSAGLRVGKVLAIKLQASEVEILCRRWT